MAFLDTIFPEKISYGSSGGPIKNTRVATAASGFEQRQTFWNESLRRYDISYGIRNFDDLYEVLQLYEVANGKEDFFLFLDNSDFKSTTITGTISDTDAVIGTGDAIEVDFQLVKEYNVGSTIRNRTIRRPKLATTICAIDGVPEGSFTVDIETGIVTFSVAPADTLEVTAGYEFYVPVRFDTDDLSWILSHFQHGIIDAVLLVEIKE